MSMVYANNAGTSWPKPPEVHQAVASALAQDPVENGDLLRRSRETICRFLGIADPGRLILTLGCTSALSVVLEDLPWQAGDGIVTSSLEHHALARPVLRLARSRGIVHHQAPYRLGEPVDLEFVEGRLKEGRVRLVAVTGASNITGEILPVETLAELAHHHGALCLVDAAQTVGMIPVDLSSLGADILVFAGHKGPLGPQGVGGLWAAPEVIFESPSAVCDITPGRDLESSCSVFPGGCDVGSVNLPAIAGLAAGMEWLASRGGGDPGSGPRELARSLVNEIEGRAGVEVIGGGGTERTASVSLRMKGLPVEKAEALFGDSGIVIRAGQHCAPLALRALGRPEGTIRISFGHFNTEEHLQRILRVLEAAAAAS